MQIEKNDKWSLTRFKSIAKISHSNYLQFCNNFVIFYKVAFFLTVAIVFSVCKQNFTAQ